MKLTWQKALAGVLAAIVAVVLWWWQGSGDGAERDPLQETSSTPTAGTTSTPLSATDPESGLPWVAIEDLPVEAEETLVLIDDGGPFPYDRDGITFGNFEGILPDHSRGYYTEYTVPTPGLSHRGARRVVVGNNDEYYWTEDHYESFERIDW